MLALVCADGFTVKNRMKLLCFTDICLLKALRKRKLHFFFPKSEFCTIVRTAQIFFFFFELTQFLFM